MKTIATLLLGLCASAAFALDIQPYTPQAFADLQQAGKPVALHFHADWCPTCRAQEKVFNQWKGDTTVPGTLLVANYDKEKDLKKQYGVRSQSTVIVFKGSMETARLGGATDPATLRTALQSAQ
ncbi:thioredoxin family protein [Rhodoferax sp.]|uniref:thioredoxin family protein n=1 Tax=Rhodoferax sp. TaxID=50421 RepID=UPI0025D326B8|nr:thioredoxin family protein [Rhodoferax sp.]